MSECIVCLETVTNPICPMCINKGIEQWLREKDLPYTDLSVIGVEGENCMKCGDHIDVCLYCHTKQVYDWLKDNNTPTKLLDEFVEFFHFDLEKKGYLTEEGYC